jgi:hypothetical protein
VTCRSKYASRLIEDQTGSSIRKFVLAARYYRTIRPDPGRDTGNHRRRSLPGDLRQVLDRIPRNSGAY